MSTSLPKPQPYHHGDLRRALLDGAMAMLESGGAANLGLRELARVLKVSPAAPYRHFDNKISLLEALAVRGYQQFSAQMKEAAIGDTAEARLAAMGHAYVRFALDNMELFRLMFSPELKRANRPTLRMAADAAFETLRIATATSSPDGGRIAALQAWAKVHGLAILLLDGQIAIREGENLDGLIRAVIGTEPAGA